MKSSLTKQAKQFIQEICVDTWGMNKEEVIQYCLMIVKQNLAMSKINKNYLETAVAFAPYAGLLAEEVKDLKNSLSF